jgi:hypothetical protein
LVSRDRLGSPKKVRRGLLVFQLQVLQEFRVASDLPDSERKAKKALQGLLVSEHPEQPALQALPERGLRVLRDILKKARRALLEFRGRQLPLAPVSLILLRSRTPQDLSLSRRVSMP